MNGRGYDYNLGRFLSVDPFITETSNSQAINPYSYILNNPLSGTDPTGYKACRTGARIGCGGFVSSAERKEAKEKAKITGVAGRTKGGRLVVNTKGNGRVSLSHRMTRKILTSAANKIGNLSSRENGLATRETGNIDEVTEADREKLNSSIAKVRADYPSLPNHEGLKITGVAGLGLGGDPDHHGQMVDKNNIRIAVKRTEDFVRVIVFHELLHLDKLMKVAGGNKALWALHELVTHGVEFNRKNKYYISGRHNPHVDAYDEQYRRYLQALNLGEEYLTEKYPDRYGKPDINKLPWRLNEKTGK